MAGPEKPPDGVTVAYIGMGANLGDARATLAAAVEALADLGDVRAVSPLYETDPVGFEDQPVFLNGAVAIATRLSPHELLDGAVMQATSFAVACTIITYGLVVSLWAMRNMAELARTQR